MRWICLTSLAVALPFTAMCPLVAQPVPPDEIGDRIRKSAKILEEGIKDAKEPAERIRLKRALSALRENTSTISILNYGKGESINRADLGYSITQVVTDSDHMRWSITVQITNKFDDPVPFPPNWERRVVRVRLFDSDGGEYEWEGETFPSVQKIEPKKALEFTFTFNRGKVSNAIEYYFELPRERDHPPTIVLIPIASAKVSDR